MDITQMITIVSFYDGYAGLLGGNVEFKSKYSSNRAVVFKGENR